MTHFQLPVICPVAATAQSARCVYLVPDTNENLWAEAALCNAATGIVHTGHTGFTLAMHIQAIIHTGALMSERDKPRQVAMAMVGRAARVFNIVLCGICLSSLKIIQ